MAREEARIFTSVWDDKDFLAMTSGPQRLYLFLLSQPDLSYCGVIALRERRWSSKAKGLTREAIESDLAILAGNPSANPSGNPSGNPSLDPPRNPFLIVDENTEEVFVRSLIRRDGIWKIPNLLKAARESARLIQSLQIRDALLAELYRLPLHESDSPHVRRVLADFIADLGGEMPTRAANPSGNPSGNPSAKGSGNPSPNPSQGKGVRGKGSISPSVTPTGSSFVSEPSDSDATPAPDADTAQATPPPREDVERICAHLADHIQANGSKRPTITQEWRDAARLMIDKDGRTEDQIRAAIDWSQADEFWRANILSMPKLRKQYDQLRLQASRAPGNGHARPRGQSQNAQNLSAARERAIEAEIRMGLRPTPTHKIAQGEIVQ